MKTLKRILALALLLPSVALAQIPNYTLPQQTVVGRSGTGPGPAEAIPFAKFRNLLSASTTTSIAGVTTTYNYSQNGYYIARSNSGASMSDVLPGTSPGVMAQGAVIYVKNDDASGLLAITVGSGSTLDGSASGFVLLGPKQSTTIYSDGTGYRSVNTPARAKMSPTVQTVLYVGTTGGSDNNPCVLSTAPCATLQAAADRAYQRIDLGEGQLSIQALTAGTFSSGVYLRGRPPGLGNPSGTDPFYHAIQFRGDPNTPSNFIINVASGNCFTAINDVTFAIDGFKLVCAGHGIQASNNSILGIEHIEYGAVGGSHLSVDGGAYIHFDNSYTISGGAQYHMYAFNNGVINSNGAAQTATLTGTPAFSSAFIGAQSGGIINTNGFSYSGAATGTRWATGPYGGAINNTFGTACDSIFPGNAAGSNSGGGMCGTGDTTFANVTLSGVAATQFITTDANKKLSGFGTANNGVLVTNGSGGPSISSTLPNGLAMQTPASINLSNASSLPATALTGTLQAAQEPAHTGGCTNSAGSVALSCTINTPLPMGFGGNCGAMASNTTVYFGPTGCQNATEALAQTPVSPAFTLKNLYVSSSAAPGGAQTYVLTVRKNGADTAITCTISASATTCNDTTHTVSFAVGDLLDVKVVASTTAAAATMQAMSVAVTTSP